MSKDEGEVLEILLGYLGVRAQINHAKAALEDSTL